MVNKIILAFIFVLCLIPMVDGKVFRQNDDLVIDHKCTLGGYPINTARANITVKNPLNEIVIDFRLMTFNTSTLSHQIILNSSQTNLFGNWEYEIFCTNGIFNETRGFDFDLNPSGLELTSSESILYGIMFIVLFGFFMLSLWGFLKLPFRNIRDNVGNVIQINWKKQLKMACLAFMILIVMVLLNASYNISLGFLHLDSIGNFFNVLFRITIALFFPAFIATLLFMAVSFFIDLRLSQRMEQGRYLPSVERI